MSEGQITAVCGGVLAIINALIAYKLHVIHKLTNSNFSKQHKLIEKQSDQLGTLTETVKRNGGSHT